MNWSSKSLLTALIIFLFKCGTLKPTMTTEEPVPAKIILPTSHTALSGDLTIFVLSSVPTTPWNEGTTEESIEDTIQIETKVTLDNTEEVSEDPLVLRVLYQNGFESTIIGEVALEKSPTYKENVSVTIPCEFFSRGGSYEFQLRYESQTVSRENNKTGFPIVKNNNVLHVKWPTPSLYLEPRHFGTYPKEPILATLRYSEISCVPSDSVPSEMYALNLIYCGYNVASCKPEDKNRTQSLYYQELNGFTTQKVIFLRCEFFGLAGNYILSFRALDANSNAPFVNALIEVEWSDEFKFNVHARSVYPCEGSAGVPVLFEYPSCRLAGDRVRVYGRLRADVASYAPPSTLHYITELKAPSGKYALNFDCEIFTEKFVEYCFAYVSQAITGAMAEVKIACIPTFPLRENEAGGWGPWSPWTPCSSSCVGGIRSRYRFCDTPPPSYGAKFCQGRAVETESCGGHSKTDDPHKVWSIADWKCHHGSEMRGSNSEVTTTVVGSQCRCGCIVDFREQTTGKILTANTQACPGRSFWLLQATSDFVVALHLDQAQFPCPGQYFRVRDGDSLSANLLTDIAFDKSAVSETLVSTGRRLLLEFFSDEASAATEACVGGFLVRASTFYKRRAENATSPLVPFEINSTSLMERSFFWTTPAHSVAASLLILTFFITVLLALQFAFKYRKYRIAEDLDHLSDDLVRSESVRDLARMPKTLSSSTLISEVVSLVGDTEKDALNATSEVKQSDTEDGYESSGTQTEYEDEIGTSSETLKLNQLEETRPRETVIIPNVSNDSDDPSTVSSVTVLGQPEIKYARPVKLRTLESTSSLRRNTPVPMESNDDVRSSPTTSIEMENLRRYRNETNQSVREKELSFIRGVSNTSVSGSGKETKDRRNRERLLQGPSTEFNLTNSEVELELDYYDYNVANASAVPGSYLGMDPAFLVWIPPLTSDDSEVPEEGGIALTPAEYKNAEANASHSNGSSIDRRARLNERLLPLHRILEDSRVRVSEESLSGHAHRDETTPEKKDNRLFEEHVRSALSDLRSSESNDDRPTSRPSSRRSTRRKEIVIEEGATLKRILDEGGSESARDDLSPNFEQLNVKYNRSEFANCVDIPMAEFSGLPSKSRIPTSNETVISSKIELQSPDYGVELDARSESESFYAFSRDDGIKFADEDDDCVDNKIVV